MQALCIKNSRKILSHSLPQNVYVLSGNYIIFHQVSIMVLCISNVIQSQIDKCTSCDKVCVENFVYIDGSCVNLCFKIPHP